MDGARSHARSRAQEVVSAWLAGDYDAVTEGCTPDVRWWTPLRGETVSGPAEVRAELQRILGEPSYSVTALVPSDDGTRCVVELTRPALSEGEPPRFVTTVLELRDGRVAAGRTYAEVESLDQRTVEGT